LTDLEVDLTKLETICHLTDQKYHKRVQSLSADEVQELDEIVETAGLDHFRYKYYERTQSNSQIPLTVRAELYGLINPSEEEFEAREYFYK
jgi:hypothetical protein